MQASVSPIRYAAALVLVTAGAGHPAWAEGLVRGTDGLVPLPFAAANASGQPIACAVATAHWYTVELGTARPQAEVARTFWVAPATGTVFVLNARQDRMPVEQLWCGFAGRAWDTRALVDLGARAGRRPQPFQVTCRSEDTRLRCDPTVPAPQKR